MNNYRINLISPYDIDDEKAKKIHSNLKQVMLYIKSSNDKKKLQELVQNDKKFLRLEKDAACVINVFTNSNLKIDKEQEVVNMC